MIGGKGAWPWLVVAASALGGLLLIADQARHLSSTYDEVAYLEVAAHWWRTGEQAVITRMGSPRVFWKAQQAPTLGLIDRLGDPRWIDDPIGHQAQLLPVLRLGAAWVWLAALGVTAALARRLGGPPAMALAAAVFALSPNLLAHGTLLTMELPVTAALGGSILGFHRFLVGGRRADFLISAALMGLAFACKFTAVVVPPILAVVWGVDRWLGRDQAWPVVPTMLRLGATVAGGMVVFGLVMVLADLAATGFAVLPLSGRVGAEHPVADRLGPTLRRLVLAVLERDFPADWVGFARQVVLQREGGPSYLLGERRLAGWWYYYPVTLLVKVPLAVWGLVLVRLTLRGTAVGQRAWILPTIAGLFLVVAMLGSKRNYGVRYLLPMAPLIIAWLAAGLASASGWRRWAVPVGLGAMAWAVASVHPAELSYFNRLAGGPVGGRRVLADSNLDWGQGARAVARLQAREPEFRDLTWYAFGDTDPRHFGVVGTIYLVDAHRAPADFPPEVAASTRYLAVSASLQWGPWGPPGYFGLLSDCRPVRYSDDWTVAIYRTSDLVRVSR